MAATSPLTRPSGRLALAGALGLAVAPGCKPPDDVLPTFHGPEHSAVLHPDDGSPFN